MTNTIELKFRNKEWRIRKDAHCHVLERKAPPKKEGEEFTWAPVGYYNDINAMFQKLVKEHLVQQTTQREIAQTFKQTCKELTDAFKAAV